MEGGIEGRRTLRPGYNTASTKIALLPLNHARTNSSVPLIVFSGPLRSLCARNK